MARRSDQTRTHLAELFRGRPAWRLEPRTTPGASPLWCYVVDGQIELSVTAERDGIHLYVMDGDRELLFADAESLEAWMRAHRGELLGEAEPRPPGKDRVRRFFEWG
jgi:hypothetical protein